MSDFKKGYQANLKAMEYEKNKDIEKAIEFYEKAISYSFDGNYPYDRLAILYRKRKDYDNEIRVLNKAIKVFSSIKSNRCDVNPKLEKFKQRLLKAQTLKNKQ